MKSQNAAFEGKIWAVCHACVRRDRSVALYRKGCDLVIVRDASGVVIGSEVPGFVLDARAIFESSEEAH
jgi:hypothetical protein